MPKVLAISELNPSDIPANSYVVFGGTFDPIHAGHVSVLRSLLAIFPKVLVAPTDQNPWKKRTPAPVQVRNEMIRLVLKAEGLDFSGKQKIEISNFPYTYTEELAKHLQKTRAGEIYWAVGEDSKDSVTKWRNWEKLPITIVTVPVAIDTHSTDVHLGSTEVHPAIVEYVESLGLYERKKG